MNGKRRDRRLTDGGMWGGGGENKGWRGVIKGEVDGGRKVIVQELCESRGGRPGLSVLTSLLVSVDVKIY